MKFQEPDNSQWKILFEGAARLKEMAPWEWMDERDVFGVKDPDSGEIGFVSFMGAAGEHFAMALYLGLEGLAGFWEMQRQEGLMPLEQLLEIPQLQVSFEDRDVLMPHDYRIIKELGLRFRGRNAWPMFQSFHPGYFPWKLNRKEAAFLVHALDQALEVALTVREDPLKLERQDPGVYLLRVPNRPKGNGLAWKEEFVRMPMPGPKSIQIYMDPQALEDLKRMPWKSHELQLDLFMVPASIGAKGDRPACTYMLLMVHGNTGFVLGFELMTVDPDLDTMRGRIPAVIVRHLAKLGYRPKEISVRNLLAFDLLEPFTGELGIRLRKKKALKQLDMAKAELIEHFESFR